MIGLMDCNNFFVSCERVFAPALRHRPVVVLSNNDGCVVSRSNEAKAMGIKMGEPYFRLKHLADEGRLDVRSSNYVLYGDMSRRVMQIARRAAPRIEVYSIDECFLDLGGTPDPKAYGEALAARVQKCTGIPVSVGVASTKTLAKVASRFAKAYPGYRGCCVIGTEEKRRIALQRTPVGDVWGIGRRTLPRLAQMGLQTAWDLSSWSRQAVERQLQLPGLQTWNELNGTPAKPIETETARKSLTCSHSFKAPIDDYETLRGQVAGFAATCAEKLRREHSTARTVTAYVRTDRFRTDRPQYENAASLTLDVGTADPRELIAAATRCLKGIFRSGYGYKKAGVTLTDLSPAATQQHLFDNIDRRKQARLLKAFDSIRAQMGDNALHIATQDRTSETIRREHSSRRFTTCLDEIIVLKDLCPKTPPPGKDATGRMP